MIKKAAPKKKEQLKFLDFCSFLQEDYLNYKQIQRYTINIKIEKFQRKMPKKFVDLPVNKHSFYKIE